MSQICLKCKRYAADHKFCEYCGEPTTPAPRCIWCGTTLEFPSAAFCPNCGRHRNSSSSQTSNIQKAKYEQQNGNLTENQARVMMIVWVIIGIFALAAGLGVLVNGIGWWKFASVIFLIMGIYGAFIRPLQLQNQLKRKN